MTSNQLPEGKAIADAVAASGRSVRSLAAEAGISDTRWRHIVNGAQPLAGGTVVPVRAPAATLARMAQAVGISADELRALGRHDAATEIERSPPGGAVDAESVGPSPQDVEQVMLDLPSDVTRGLSSMERDRIIQAAKLAAYRESADIKAARDRE